MKINVKDNKFSVMFEDFDLGLSKGAFQGGRFVAPGTFNINFSDEPGILTTQLELGNDVGTIVSKLGRGILGSSNGILGLGVNSSQIAVFSLSSLASLSSDATLIDADAGDTAPENGTAFVEWQDYAWFYQSGTAIAKFGTISSGTGTIALSEMSSLNSPGGGLDILATKTFLYACNGNSVTRSTAHNAHNTTAITFSSDEIVISLSQLGQYIIVATAPKGNTRGPIRLYKWDGVSNNVDGQPILIPDNGLRLIRNVGGVILVFCISLDSNSAEKRYFRVYRWDGGENSDMIYERNILATAYPTTNNYYIHPANVDVYNNKAWFGFKANETSTLGIENGIYSIDRNGKVILEHVPVADTSDTSDIGYYFVRWIGNNLFTYHLNGSTERFSHASLSSGNDIFSSNAPLVLPAFRPDVLRKSRINRIKFLSKSLPASTSFVLAEKVDQASSFTTVKTFSTTGLKSCQTTGHPEYIFQDGNIHQLRITLAASNNSKPELILPIIVEGEILNDYT